MANGFGGMNGHGPVVVLPAFDREAVRRSRFIPFSPPGVEPPVGEAVSSKAMKRAAIGVSSHSGWAVLVVVSMDAGAVEVIARRRIVLTDAQGSRANQPFHFAEKLKFPAAERYLQTYAEHSDRLALAAIREALRKAEDRGYRVGCSGILQASGRPLPELRQILASHALIHAAEGQLFRDVLRRACEKSGFPVFGYPQRDLATRAKTILGPAAAATVKRIALLGRALGPPWASDQKMATLAACLALQQTGQD